MKAKVRSMDGKEGKEVSLPNQFEEQVRPDLIKRAVLAIHANSRQPYGAYFDAGTRHLAKTSKRRRKYKTSYGYGISRVPRKIMSRSGTRMNWVGAFAPHTVGGRKAHPPKPQKDWSHKINKKERRKAIRSALAATAQEDYVKARGHVFTSYPIIVEDNFEKLNKTSEVLEFLAKNGLEEEISRVSEKKVRAGRGKSRGRKYKTRVGPLLVVSKKCPLQKACRNIPGIDVEVVTGLNAELLAPGTMPGRLTIFTESSIKRLNEEKLYAK